MKSKSRAVLGSAIILLTNAFCASGEDLKLDWGFIGEGKAISGSPYGPQGFPVFIQSKTAVVIDSSTTPPNPFPGSERALFVETSTENPVSRIRIRPFPEDFPADGSWETTFQIVEGFFSVSTGVIQLPWDPANDWAYIQTDPLVAINFAAGKAIQCKSVTDLRTDGVPTLLSAENYTFRAEWQTEGDSITFQWVLNGEPVRSRDGLPFTVSVPKSKVNAQSLSIAITVGAQGEPTSKVIFGGISASAGKP